MAAKRKHDANDVGDEPAAKRSTGGVANYKRILVTGGAGFVGSHLCDRLVREGHQVICLDNLFTSQKTNIEHLLGQPNFEFIRHDVTDPIKLEVDQIYNLACPAAPGHYQHNPVKTMQTCVIGAMNMLELARTTGATILQTSTSEVYGDPIEHPQQEHHRGNVSCTGIRACYDEGKRAAETLFFDYHRMHKTRVRVIRIFNTYGPKMHPYDGRVVSNFCRQAAAGEDITIYGDGSQTRSFQFVDDLVEAMVRMMNNEEGFIGPVNIGNPEEYTVKQLAEMIVQLSGTTSRVIYKELPSDDPTRRRPDITLAGEKLHGWRPHVKLAEGLLPTIEYFKNLDLSRYRPPTQNY